MIDLPEAVSQAEWQAAHEALLAKEKAATHARDALTAGRLHSSLGYKPPAEFEAQLALTETH